MLDVNSDSYQIGLVKWFGGHNYQKDKENDFGFIVPGQGNDLFVHKNEIQNGNELNEDELVVFEKGQNKGKQCAKNVHRVSNDSSAAIIAFRIYFDFEAKEGSLGPATFARPVQRMVSEYLGCEDDELISFLRKQAHQYPDIFRVISSHWSSYFEKFVGKRSISELIDFGVSVCDIPSHYIKEHKDEFIEYVNEIDEEARHDFLKSNFSYIPINFSESDEFLSSLRQAVRKYPEVLGSIEHFSDGQEYFERIVGEWSISELIG